MRPYRRCRTRGQVDGPRRRAMAPARPRERVAVRRVVCIRGVGLAQQRRAARRRNQDHVHEPMGDRRGIIVRGPFGRTLDVDKIGPALRRMLGTLPQGLLSG
jgi:hypothetical protein